MPQSRELRHLNSSGGHAGQRKNDPIQLIFTFNNITQQILWNVTPAAISAIDNNDDSI
jgi:hypothetical protein